MRLDDIDLSDLDGFWSRPIDERNAAYATLRREAPVQFFAEHAEHGTTAGPGYYALTRYSDIVTASKNPQVFRSGAGTNICDVEPENRMYFSSLLNVDDPEHTRTRRIVSTGFTPRTLARVETEIVTIAYEIVDEVRALGACDFVTDIAAVLSTRVTASLMGFPRSCLDRVAELTNILFGGHDDEYAPDGVTPAEAAATATIELAEIIDEVADSRVGKEGDDLTTAMVNNVVEGEQLSRREFQALFMLLCGAADVTTRDTMSWGLWYLSENPAERAKWQDDFDGVTRTAIEEILRVASPMNYFRRTVTRDGARLGDYEFSEGDKVVLLYGAGNRDEDNFAKPEQFDVLRDPNNHLGFGGPGPHYCLGAHLARREVTMIYKALFECLPDITAVGEPDRLRSDIVNGIKHLPCEFTAT